MNQDLIDFDHWYFLTFNPSALFTEEVELYLQSKSDSYILTEEHKKTNAHVHIVAYCPIFNSDKTMNQNLKDKFPNLKVGKTGSKTGLVIKPVHSIGIMNYLAKEAKLDCFEPKYYNHNPLSPDFWNQRYLDYKYNQKHKTLKEKFNAFFLLNENKYRRYPLFKDCVLFAFMDFQEENDIKDCGPFAYEKYFYYLLTKHYKEHYFDCIQQAERFKCMSAAEMLHMQDEDVLNLSYADRLLYNDKELDA